jgi:G3E family GTPase
VLTSEEQIYEFTNGCICCVGSVRTDLIEILKNLMGRREKFDHILVETSGLADPQPVAATFFVDDEVARQVTLDGIVTLVDAKHIGQHLDDPRLHGHDNQAVDQIVTADRVIVNKVDLVDEAEATAIEARVRGLNATAEIIRSSYAKVALHRILGIGAFDLAHTMAVEPDLDDHHARARSGGRVHAAVFDAHFDRYGGFPSGSSARRRHLPREGILALATPPLRAAGCTGSRSCPANCGAPKADSRSSSSAGSIGGDRGRAAGCLSGSSAPLTRAA